MHVQDSNLVWAERACPLAEPWFAALKTKRVTSPTIRDKPVSLEDALATAAARLAAARNPLIYGLANSSTPGQRAACRLADTLGATIDTTASRCHAPSIMALQQVGESTCSLGEVRHRADLVIYWGSNPVRSHPRHMERYTWEPSGMFLPPEGGGRTLAVIDVKPTETAELADLYLQVEKGQDFEVAWALRSLVLGKPLPQHPYGGVSWRELVELAERMKSCQCGIIFFGLGLARGPLGHHHVEAVLRLVTDLNAHTRFHAKRMRIPGDVAGADSVLCWQTGYPFSVNLQRGYPRYNPGEYSADDILRREEADVCLLVGTEGVAGLSAEAKKHLSSIPVICLEAAHFSGYSQAEIRIPTDVYGVHRTGTAYRMDEVPIPLRSFLPSEHPSDAEILADLERRIRAMRASLTEVTRSSSVPAQG